jgi:D-glycero-alpha-D-manno-heptose 1-phosphate guanylyltransferase
MKLLILAGGFGTRLKPAVTDMPKPLAPIGDVPFLQLQIEHWLAQGLREFTFLLHHQADLIIAFLKSQQTRLPRDCKVEWVVEPIPMNTGGAVAHAIETLGLKSEFLMTNADTWLGSGILAVSQASAPAIAVINLADVSRFGQVHFDHNNRVRCFSEKNNQCTAGWVNAGMYLLNVELFKNWDGLPFSMELDLFASLVKDQRLNAVPLHTDFIDIGVSADYFRFCRWEASGRQKPLCN